MRLLSAAAAAVSIAAPALGQGQCAPADVAVAMLAEQYGEAPQVGGMSTTGAYVVFFANAETGTWTAVIFTPDGGACMAAAGEGFEYIAEPPAPMGTDG